MITILVSLLTTVLALGSVNANVLPPQTGRLNLRAYTSSAVCLSDYAWTDNSKNVSPCVLAANVLGTCAGTTWNVPPLTGGVSYSVPTVANNTANLCSCSWAAYNLLSACTICQGLEASVQNWPQYKSGCGSYLSDSYFPSQQVLPSDLSIPAYAAKDPSTWSDARFNLQEARSIHDQGSPDLVQNPSKRTSSTPVGAIVGGVIGALAIICAAAGIAFWFYRKKQLQKKDLPTTYITPLPPGHTRNMSDLSQASTMGYSPSSYDQTPISPGSPMHTHAGSIHSMSYFGSVAHSIAPAQSSVGHGSPESPGPRSYTRAQAPPSAWPAGRAREDIIVPFTLSPLPDPSNPLPHPSATHLVDRKRTDGAMIPVYDPPNLHNDASMSMLSVEDESGPSHRRMNPPAYSAIDEGSPSIRGPPPRSHKKKVSAETHRSTSLDLSGNQDGAVPLNLDAAVSPIDERTLDGIEMPAGGESVIGARTIGTDGGTLATGMSREISGPGRGQAFRS